MIYSEAQDILKTVGIIAIILVVGLVLVIIGIQHEHLTKLRDRKAELEIMIKDLEKKNEELEKSIKKLENENNKLEKELCKYDKKRKRNKE